MTAQITDPDISVAPITVDNPTVACDGGGGALGHPTVYLKIGPERQIVCPYCSRQFILAEGASTASGH